MDEQVLNELLECSVCLERLNHTSKVLPCQHTFCRRCLDEIVSTKHELRCPECRYQVQENVEDLPTNILLVRLLEGLKQHNTAIVTNHRSRSPGRKNENSSGTGSQSGSRQMRQSQIGSQPCARALFNYDAKDNGDLTFKKGDSIVLRKQIDENWYHGELNGQHGFFPASYVQVIVPLLTTLPQCKALYDFEMKDEKEKDCLCFKKDEVLTVIRRVDDNWLEGKKGDRIGIFPISFVELNEPAKNLVNGKNGNTQAPSIQQPLERHDGDGGTMPSLLQGLQPSSSAQQLSHQQKRHSYTDASSRNSPLVQQHRHSLELGSNTDLAATASVSAVLSTEASSATMSGTAVLTNSNSSNSTSQLPGDKTNKAVITKSVMTNTNANNSTSRLSGDMTNKAVCTKSVMTNTNGGNVTSQTPCEMNNKSVATKSTCTTQNGQIWHSPVQSVNSGNSAYTNTSSVPFAVSQNTPIYIAMYNYRPQKDDELELKKGDYYTVSEKCQDGWFKGKCLKTGQIGVFPGNYVQNIRSQSVHHKSAVKNGTNQTHAINASTSPNLSTYVPLPSRPKTSPGRSKSMDRGDRDKGPPVVPRGQRGTHISPSHSAKGANLVRSGNDSVNIKSGHHTGFIQTKPTGQQTNLTSRSMSPSQVSAGVSPQDERHLAQMGQKSSSSSISSTSSSSSASPVWKHSMLACSNITPPNVVVGATGEITPANPPKEKKEKKEKEKLSLVKRLTSGKSKKSKFSTDSEGASLSDSSITHARSGSFPSDPAVTSLAESSHHKKSGSFDSTSSSASHKPSRPKPPTREKHHCIVPYPPQGEIELELKIGDIVYVHKKRDDGWFKGTLQRTGKTGLFPGSFVEKCE